jgi:hypothetical protein
VFTESAVFFSFKKERKRKRSKMKRTDVKKENMQYSRVWFHQERTQGLQQRGQPRRLGDIFLLILFFFFAFVFDIWNPL